MSKVRLPTQANIFGKRKRKGERRAVPNCTDQRAPSRTKIILTEGMPEFNIVHVGKGIP